MLPYWAGKSGSEIEMDNFVFFECRWPKIESPNYGKYSLGGPWDQILNFGEICWFGLGVLWICLQSITEIYFFLYVKLLSYSIVS